MRVDIEIEVDMLYTGQTLNPTVTDITEKVFIMKETALLHPTHNFIF